MPNEAQNNTSNEVTLTTLDEKISMLLETEQFKRAEQLFKNDGKFRWVWDAVLTVVVILIGAMCFVAGMFVEAQTGFMEEQSVPSRYEIIHDLPATEGVVAANK